MISALASAGRWLSTVLVWAGPAQVILISALGTGAKLIEIAVAVCLSSVRLLPMVVALLPLIRAAGHASRELLLPAHFTAVSMWVEVAPPAAGAAARARLAFCNGSASASCCRASSATAVGFYLAAALPPLLRRRLLFLTPMSFLVSTARNSRLLVERLALGARARHRPAAGLSTRSGST